MAASHSAVKSKISLTEKLWRYAREGNTTGDKTDTTEKNQITTEVSGWYNNLERLSTVAYAQALNNFCNVTGDNHIYYVNNDYRFYILLYDVEPAPYNENATYDFRAKNRTYYLFEAIRNFPVFRQTLDDQLVERIDQALKEAPALIKSKNGINEATVLEELGGALKDLMSRAEQQSLYESCESLLNRCQPTSSVSLASSSSSSSITGSTFFESKRSAPPEEVPRIAMSAEQLAELKYIIKSNIQGYLGYSWLSCYKNNVANAQKTLLAITSENDVSKIKTILNESIEREVNQQSGYLRAVNTSLYQLQHFVMNPKLLDEFRKNRSSLIFTI